MQHKLAQTIFVLLVLVVGVFFRAVWLDYVWDDWALFVNDPSLRNVGSLEDLWSALTKPILPGTTYFRPLVLLSFVGQYRWLDHGPMWGHIFNVALHAVNTILVLLLARLILAGSVDDVRRVEFLAAIGALIYGLHPAMIEPVAWISGRFDLLVTTFSLSAMLAALQLRRWWRVGVTAVLFFFAALSKEMAAVLPILIFLVIASVEVKDGDYWLSYALKSAFSRYLCLAILLVFVGCGYVLIRYLSLGRVAHVDVHVDGVLTNFTRVVLVGLTIFFYIKTAFWPFFSNSPQHPVDIKSFSDFDAALGVCVFLVFFLAVFLLLRSRSRISPVALAALVSLLPVLNIIPLTIGGNIGHERFMALPLAFFSIAVAMVLGAVFEFAKNGVKVVCTVLVFWLFLSAFSVYTILPMWANDLTLWSWVYRSHPKNEYVARSYASAAYKYHQYDTLQKVLDELQGYTKDTASLHALRGAMWVRLGRHKEGIEYIEMGLRDARIRPPHLGLVEAGLAIESLSADTKNFPYAADFSFAYTALAEGYLGVRDFGGANRNAVIARFYAERYPPATLILALSHYGLGDKEVGDKYYAEAISYFRSDAVDGVQRIRDGFLAVLCEEPIRYQGLCE